MQRLQEGPAVRMKRATGRSCCLARAQLAVLLACIHALVVMYHHLAGEPVGISLVRHTKPSLQREERKGSVTWACLLAGD